VTDAESLSSEQFLYLTTTGRRTGNPHEIEIWFGTNGRTVYILAGGREKSDTVRNIMANRAVRVRIGKHTFAGTGRVLGKGEEDALARRLLLEKYEPTYSGDLKEWGETALPVAVDLGDEIS
jgi:deazaflavin-dependent oxidoreductase (nitroreductase family)